MSIQDVEQIKIQELFGQGENDDKNINLMLKIPKYQREYSWDKKQCEKLFDDIKENENGYFLGSIIVITASKRELEIVDGQQRLITISLLLAAIYYSLKEIQEKQNIKEELLNIQKIKNELLLLNNTRVIPQKQNKNKEDFEYLFGDIGIIKKTEKPKNFGNRRISKIFNYFKNCIKNETNNINEDEKINCILNILNKINSANIVDISVENHASAYILFEALNNRGTPLTSIDLIKNLILAKLDNPENSKSLDDCYSQWNNILENLGDEYSIQERFFRQNYNAFRKTLNTPFIKNKDDNSQPKYPLGSIATRSNVLDIYEKIITLNPQQALDELCENSKIYAQLIVNKEEGISDGLKQAYLNIQRIEGVPSYIPLIYLIKNKSTLNIDDKHIIDICELLVKFFVRRNLTNIPGTQDLQHIFMSFIEQIEDEKLQDENIYNKLLEILKSKAANDEIFKEKLNGAIYEDNKNVARFILCSIEEENRNIENEIKLWEKEKNKYIFSIEHIFPKGENIPDCWVRMITEIENNEPITEDNRKQAQELKEKYVHTLGNLTITAYNSNLGNESFKEKRDRKKDNNHIGYKNGFYLNKDVAYDENGQERNKWTVEIIQQRTNNMIKKILENDVFTSPETLEKLQQN
ncbi:MAG: DUF262 domain-containing protein [Neisseriaceae bacterium]|nr:DUF262 domain-containing protein [Neisseriaceae bacterium]